MKNLESIQGDERDVILISVGYGRDESGYMSMNFGPLSSEGGERRLNVLITRARRRCEVYASISAADIDLARGRSPGVAALKAFLHYAETGVLDVPAPTGKDPDSVFEEEVARQLRTLGFDVEHQVGIAGFFVDLAIRDPERPGAYLLGIECDGATYHSTRSARDRDRLRQQVLEDRGWIIHRIWSTDWFHRPEEELRKTVEAIERARGMVRPTDKPATPADSGEPAEAEPPVVEPPRPIEREPEVGPAKPGANSGEPYREADFTIVRALGPHEVPVAELAEIVIKVVDVEGPVHALEVGRRVATVWGLQRAGRRIQHAAAKALSRAVKQGVLIRDGNFYSKEARDEVPPRSRENVSSSTLRNPEMLPPAEIRTAVRMTVADHVGITVEEAFVQVARLFGFQRTSSGLKTLFEKELRQCLYNGDVQLRGDKLYGTDH